MGYLLSDWVHLREELSSLQTDMERLTQATKQAEHEKQQTLIDLQSCQQIVNQLNQTIARLNDENTYLKESNAIEAASQNPVVQSTTFDLIPFIVLALGLTGMLELKILRKQFHLKRPITKEGSYVHLTDVEIKELVQWRRHTSNSSIGNAVTTTKSMR